MLSLMVIGGEIFAKIRIIEGHGNVEPIGILCFKTRGGGLDLASYSCRLLYHVIAKYPSLEGTSYILDIPDLRIERNIFIPLLFI